MRIKTFAVALIATLLGACASTSGTRGECLKNSICPVVIYEKSPGVFAAVPDHISIAPDKPNVVTVIWTFADQVKYRFLTKTPGPVADGLDFIDKSPSDWGVHPCYITNNSRLDAKPAKEWGTYLRCELAASAKFKDVHYRVRFHDKDGKALILDPTMSSSGGGDSMTEQDSDDPDYQWARVEVGKEARLQPIGTSDGVKVVWDAVSGTFKDGDSPMAVMDGKTPVSLQGCRATSDPDGKTPLTPARYYTCTVTTPTAPLSWTYTATYTDSGLRKTVSAPMTRP